MKVLLDECVPKRLGRLIVGHEVRTVPQMGWSGLRNGRLLSLVHGAGFQVLLTVDRNIEHQQNVAVLPLDVGDLEPLVPSLLAALTRVPPRAFKHVSGTA